MPAADRLGVRFTVLAIVVVTLFVALGGRLWYLQVMAAPSLERVAVANQVREIQVPPMRGRIVDRQGRVLADNTRTLSVTVDRKVIRKKADRESLFLRIAGALGTSTGDLEKRYEDVRYDKLLPLPLADDVDEGTAVYLRERHEDYPGVDVSEGWQRVYRYAPLASHIIGYVGKIPGEDDEKKEYLRKGYKLSDTVGLSGVERMFEDELRGAPGYRRYEVDAQNRIVRVIDEEPATPGNDVQLSVDLAVQQYTEQILERGLEQARLRQPKNKPEVSFEAPAGSVVVQDPRSGQIVAMASNPSFDNRWFIGGLPGRTYTQLFGDGTNNPLLNRAVQGEYAPASTFKVFTSVAALESGQIPNAQHTILDEGRYTVPPPCDVSCVYRNAGETPLGLIDLPRALTVSSDVYFYGLGHDIWKRPGNLLQESVRRFGFGADTGIDLPAERDGRVPSPEVKQSLKDRQVIDDGRYFIGDNILFAIGQGLMTATPLQLANAYSAFANGGTLWKPHVAQAILAPGTPDASPGVIDLTRAQVLRTFAQEALGTVALPPEVREPILQGLVGAVADPTGTAHDVFADFPLVQYPIAGKTGTAQDGSKLDEKDSSLFAAFGPLIPGQPPQYTVVAILEKAGFGAQAAAPVTKCIFQRLAGLQPFDAVVQSVQLDKTAAPASSLPALGEQSCLTTGQAND